MQTGAGSNPGEFDGGRFKPKMTASRRHKFSYADRRTDILTGLAGYADRQQKYADRPRHMLTGAAAVAGAIVAGTVHIAVICGCCLLYWGLYPPNGGRFPDVTPVLYAGYALCVAPLSMLYGAAIGVRWAQSRKSANASEMSTA